MKVIEKYQQKLTRRNYYEQELTELPSIVTILEYHDPQLKKDIYLDFEKDYHIYLSKFYLHKIYLFWVGKKSDVYRVIASVNRP